jgi:hypothetical protein
MGSFDVLLGNERTQFDVFVEEYRSALEVTLNGVTVQQARTRLVPSSTTLLGLLKHVTWMQRVWFEECVDGTSRQELGLVSNPGQSFQLAEDDTVASVTATYRQACATARAAVAELSLDAVVTGHRTGPRTLRWVYCKSCASWPTTAGTPTSCASRCLPTYVTRQVRAHLTAQQTVSIDPGKLTSGVITATTTTPSHRTTNDRSGAAVTCNTRGTTWRRGPTSISVASSSPLTLPRMPLLSQPGQCRDGIASTHVPFHHCER